MAERRTPGLRTCHVPGRDAYAPIPSVSHIANRLIRLLLDRRSVVPMVADRVSHHPGSATTVRIVAGIDSHSYLAGVIERELDVHAAVPALRYTSVYAFPSSMFPKTR